MLKGLTEKGVLSLEMENDEAATTSAAEAPAHPDVTSGDRMSTPIVAKPDEIKLPSALPRFEPFYSETSNPSAGAPLKVRLCNPWLFYCQWYFILTFILVLLFC